MIQVVAAGLIILIVSISTALFCVVLHRRKMRAQLRKLEIELETAREKRKEEAIKSSGEGEGMALRDSIARELSEESHDGGLPSPQSRQVVPPFADLPLSAADEPPPADVVEQVTAQPSAPRELTVQGAVAKPPSRPRDLAVKGASVAAGTADASEGGNGPDRNPGSNTARAMAALRSKRV